MNYIPPKDADFETWLLNFKTLIAASPATYGLVAADATTITGQYNLWHTAYVAATGGTTRGPFTIAAKDAQRVTCEATIRPYAQFIANNGGVTSGNKIAVGVNPRTNPPTPIATPTTAPVLTISGNTPLQTWVRFRDSLAIPTSRAKVAGAIACQIWAETSATPITNPANLSYVGSFTKVPVIINWDPAWLGTRVYMAARWITRRTLVGPWSDIYNLIVS